LAACLGTAQPTITKPKSSSDPPRTKIESDVSLGTHEETIGFALGFVVLNEVDTALAKVK
jgi:hypothetical protein